MSSTSTPPGQNDQRVLAAIVFTDVVSFSARMEAQESVTLALLERDFAAMRLFSDQHSGTVIKTTGDGLMLYFTSAVQAVEWALKAQRHFAGLAETLREGEILRHRVGIHLGDVFRSGGDVMGDGVNVAARVQAEARPGGICISQVVYGVVKNKLKLDVIRLEPRKLKNISESVPMYHLLLEPPAQRAPHPVKPPPEAPALPVVAKAGFFARHRVAIGVLTLGVAAGAIFLFRAYHDQQKNIAGSEERRNALAAALQSEKDKPPAAAMKPAAPPLTNAATGEYDFSKMTSHRPATIGASPRQDLALQRAREAIQLLDTWRAVELQRYTRDRPLRFQPLRGANRPVLMAFTGPDRELHVAQGGAERKRAWQELETDTQGAIIASLVRSSPAPPAREVLHGAEAFAYIHGLPELVSLLARR